jgi:hypothetical protein
MAHLGGHLINEPDDLSSTETGWFKNEYPLPANRDMMKLFRSSPALATQQHPKKRSGRIHPKWRMPERHSLSQAGREEYFFRVDHKDEREMLWRLALRAISLSVSPGDDGAK